MMMVFVASSSFWCLLLVLTVTVSSSHANDTNTASASDGSLVGWLSRWLRQDRFVDDIFHCSPNSFMDDDTVDCDPETLEWDTTALDPDFPPERCGDLRLTPGTTVGANDDWVEPCIMWHLTHGDLKPSSQPSSSPTTTPTETLSNNPTAQPVTPSPTPDPTPSPTQPPTEQPTSPPTPQPTPSTMKPTPSPTVRQTPNPTMEPTPPPVTLAPVTPSPVTTAPVTPSPVTPSPVTPEPIATSPPSFSPTVAPVASLLDKPNVRMSLFAMSLIIPKSVRRHLQDLSASREQLVAILESHLHQYFEQSLGLDILAVKLASTALDSNDQPTATVLRTQMAGSAYFPPNSVLPSRATLDFLVDGALSGSAVIEFLSRLQASKDPWLVNVQDISVLSEQSLNGSPTNNNNPPPATQPETQAEPALSTGFIIIVAAAGVAALAVGMLVYLMLRGPKGKNRRRPDSIYKSRSDESPRTQPQSDTHSDVEAQADDQSDLTSTYTYRNDEKSLVSMAPSFMYSIAGRSAMADDSSNVEDSSIQAPSLLWGGSEESYNEDLLQPAIIITTPVDKKNSSFPASSDDESHGMVMYHTDDDSMLGGAGLRSVLQIEDDQSVQQAGSPSKERKFKDLWNSGEQPLKNQKRMASDTRDWKQKYQIPDDDSVF